MDVTYIIVILSINRRLKYMLIFIDTEYTNPSVPELISIGMVSEDGQYQFYAELDDFDSTLCNRFVTENVLPQLNFTYKMSRQELTNKLYSWFLTLPRSITICADDSLDVKLLTDLFVERPLNLNAGWFDLRHLINTSIYHDAVCHYHDKYGPWHHALNDAKAHRIGWLAWMDNRKRKFFSK